MTETPAIPGIEWPEPVLTCDLIIERELKEAFRQQEHWLHTMREHMNYPAGDKSDKAQVVQYKSLMHLQSFIQSAAIADLLRTIQGMAPGLSDRIARDFDTLHQSGEIGELLWEWATERGLEPEQIIEDAKTTITQEQDTK
ncbi:hypothetical protein [Arthrobacter cryoconiti]|uniref:Uncharacterized protein n=1 Tax=Arthrobacter cryoconiti TaxID=748907 RepID=A0ABV8QY34_9MICC|nr:hypothetical protein [Arthrobacter cryoconiti]MCC9068831.1 hypothetical protein [Arthrobacter cryoconiti]